MPRMTGTELARRVKETRPDMPVILCSGFGEMMNAKKAKELGFAAFLKKPVVIAELSGAIRAVFG